MADVALILCHFGEGEAAKARWRRMALEAADRFFERHGHIADVIVSGGRNMADALNSGAHMAARSNIDYCSFVGSDGDWLSDDYFERLLPFAGPDTVAAPSVCYVEPDGTRGPVHSLESRNIEFMNPCVAASLMYTARIVEIGFKDWPVWEDWAMFLTAARRGDKIAHCDDAVYFVQEHAEGSRNAAAGVNTTEVYRDIRLRSW